MTSSLFAELSKHYLRLAEFWTAARHSWRSRRKYSPADLAPDGLPLPPPRFVMQVAGTPDVGWFLEGGRLAAQSLISLLARAELRMEQFPAILDLGCGCGRVIRCWHTLPRSVRVYGTDYNRELIGWCRQNLGFAEFQVNQLSPPLPFAPASFGLVYALSVFTHLPEPLQLPWMRDIHRVLQPGGCLIVSVHGRRYLETLDPQEQEAFEADQLVVRHAKAAGMNLCSAFHPGGYVRAKMAEGYDVIDFVSEGAKGNPYQDIYLLRKRE